MTSADEIPPKDHPVWKIILYSLALLGVLYGVSDPSILVGMI
tara:strand:- start:1121 stop:1246 length:126 start_codon:yes stop_codon:yes gene_type:complete